MPIIRLELPEGIQKEIKVEIRSAMKDVILATLAPKETYYDYVAIREVFAEIGDGVPLIEVDLRPGREVERKQALVDGLSEVLKDKLGIKRKDIYVIFRETPASEHYTGGNPLPNWVPADI